MVCRARSYVGGSRRESGAGADGRVSSQASVSRAGTARLAAGESGSLIGQSEVRYCPAGATHRRSLGGSSCGSPQIAEAACNGQSGGSVEVRRLGLALEELGDGERVRGLEE